MRAVSAIRNSMESVARSVIRNLRSTCPAAVKAIGLPAGVHATTDDWARTAALRNSGEKLIGLRESEALEKVPAVPVSLPDQPHPQFGGFIKYIEIRTFVADMRSAEVVGRNGYVLDSQRMLLGDVPRVYRDNYSPAAHPHLKVVRPPKVTRLPGVSAVLAVFSVGNYFHWMFESLPRLALLRDAGVDLEKIDWFIVNRVDNPFVIPSLAALGIPESKLRVADDGHAWKCEALFVPSMPWMTNPTARACEALRQQFLPAPSPARRQPRIFVSRKPGGQRKLTNEDAVAALLAAGGFEKIYLENYSLTEQVALFAHAEAIVGVHGAGMTNLVFCSPQTKVIELFNPAYVNNCYWSIAWRVGLKYAYLLGDGEFTGRGQDAARCGNDISISLPRLEQLLTLLEL